MAIRIAAPRTITIDIVGVRLSDESRHPRTGSAQDGVECADLPQVNSAVPTCVPGRP
jgi:hypothetical protein